MRISRMKRLSKEMAKIAGSCAHYVQRIAKFHEIAEIERLALSYLNLMTLVTAESRSWTERNNSLTPDTAKGDYARKLFLEAVS